MHAKYPSSSSAKVVDLEIKGERDGKPNRKWKYKYVDHVSGICLHLNNVMREVSFDLAMTMRVLITLHCREAEQRPQRL